MITIRSKYYCCDQEITTSIFNKQNYKCWPHQPRPWGAQDSSGNEFSQMLEEGETSFLLSWITSPLKKLRITKLKSKLISTLYICIHVCVHVCVCVCTQRGKNTSFLSPSASFEIRNRKQNNIYTTNLGSILKSRDITLSTKVCLVKAMVFPVVMYGCESWTIKKA